MRLWQRLWWRIWLAVLAAIVLVSLSSFALLRLLFDPERIGRPIDALARQVAATLPAADTAPPGLRVALDGLHVREHVDLAVFDVQGRPIAHAGRPLPPPRVHWQTSHWIAPDDDEPPGASKGTVQFERDPRLPQIYALRLDDGRWLVAGRARSGRGPLGPLVGFVLLAAGVGLGAYPVARRLTRRLERLQSGVEKLGAGQLAARVPVEGRDEVARLAASFNAAAERIELLVTSQ